VVLCSIEFLVCIAALIATFRWRTCTRAGRGLWLFLVLLQLPTFLLIVSGFTMAAVGLFVFAPSNVVAVIVAEVVYGLQEPYRQSRTAIANALLGIIQSPGIITDNSRVVTNALAHYATKNIDFTDARLAARAAESGLFINSFDKDLDKLPDLTREEPKA
jgi:predicted nucleic-acid-binding protein